MAEISDDIKSVIESIEGIRADAAMPKNVKDRLTEIMNILKGGEEKSIRVSKALDKIEEIADDSNLQPYTRTQIWNISSMLEAL